MTPRSLVGMTMGCRKRVVRARCWEAGYTLRLNRFSLTSDQLRALDVTERAECAKIRDNYRIGQRLRPCPGCPSCTDSPRLQVMGWVRRIGGRAKLTRIFSRWYQRAEYLLMIYRPGPTWNPAAGGGVTKAEAWANMCNCLRDHDELNVACDGSGVLPARAKKVRR